MLLANKSKNLTSRSFEKTAEGDNIIIGDDTFSPTGTLIPNTPYFSQIMISKSAGNLPIEDEVEEKSETEESTDNSAYQSQSGAWIKGEKSESATNTKSEIPPENYIFAFEDDNSDEDSIFSDEASCDTIYPDHTKEHYINIPVLSKPQTENSSSLELNKSAEGISRYYSNPKTQYTEHYTTYNSAHPEIKTNKKDETEYSRTTPNNPGSLAIETTSLIGKDNSDSDLEFEFDMVFENY